MSTSLVTKFNLTRLYIIDTGFLDCCCILIMSWFFVLVFTIICYNIVYVFDY